MIKVQVIEEFSFSRFDEIKNIERKEPSKASKGRLYLGDTFECSIDIASYLTKTNPLGRAFVKIVETEPEEEKPKKVEVKEMKPVKKTTKKKK